ncbi:MAG: T9SS type A sorting domain-containing protein, partial [Candidatus Symbiothrix sp.]|nr:T9SS type A sorting domain-containing protein [Candidatus Symbiothrix sp.]
DANLEADLDIFRPLHQLSAIERHTGSIASKANKIEAGLKDVWVLAGKNNSVYCNELDGYPVARWDMATSNNYLKDLTLGGFSAWGITTTGMVVRSALPNGQKSNRNDSWQLVEGDMTIVDIDASNAMIWAVDDNANIYYRNFAATRPWVKIEGKLTTIAVDELFGWGFAPDGSLKRFDLQNRTNWKTIPNPHALTHLSVNCEEVWGVNANQEVYRMSSSGYGDWELVATGYTDVSVGTNFVWFLDADGNPYKCRLTSFTDYSAFTPAGGTKITHPATPVSSTVYPNPFVNHLTLKITSHQDEKVNLSLVSIDGKVMYRNSIAIPMGITDLDLGAECQPIRPGIYLLSIEKSTGKEVIKIVKR